MELDIKKRGKVVVIEEDMQKEKKARGDSASLSPYEAARERRIEENRAVMSKLGITALSQIISSSSSSKKGDKKHRTQTVKANPPPPVRRSSRLKNANPPSNTEEEKAKAARKEGNSSAAKGEREEEEVYTENHIKLLGSCREPWDLHGKRVYDKKNGTSCHQCRQKALGHHTRCSKCNQVSGQLCGDCLYMRYGENVLEVKDNPNWICPVCRGICNCSVCRTKKGLPPTGPLYKKLSPEYKSVAHFLILSRQANAKGKNAEEPDA